MGEPKTDQKNIRWVDHCRDRLPASLDPVDPAQIDKLKQSAAAGEAAGQYLYGLHLFSQQDFASAISYFQRAAEAGLDMAQLKLGLCFLEGKGAEPDEKVAVEWMERGFDVDAMLGEGFSASFLNDRLHVDHQTACDWAEIAHQDYCEALFYFAGYCAGVDDYERAMSIYEYLNWYHDAEALYNLARVYESALNAEKYKSCGWLRFMAAGKYLDAATNGHAQAQFEMGRRCHEGNGVEQSDAHARQWLCKAQAQGVAEAKNLLDNLNT